MKLILIIYQHLLLSITDQEDLLYLKLFLLYLI
nr:MAG TPA: hypothetical protein [Caudoviricetes sp.]